MFEVAYISLLVLPFLVFGEILEEGKDTFRPYAVFLKNVKRVC